jgi:hypothetical protein
MKGFRLRPDKHCNKKGAVKSQEKTAIYYAGFEALKYGDAL